LQAIKTEKENYLIKALDKSILKSIDIEHIVFFKQYKKLLTKLSKNEINYKNMEAFYDEIQEVEKFNKAKAFVELFNDLPKFRARKIIEVYNGKTEPFEAVKKYKDN